MSKIKTLTDSHLKSVPFRSYPPLQHPTFALNPLYFFLPSKSTSQILAWE